jgi:hypothetical protein
MSILLNGRECDYAGDGVYVVLADGALELRANDARFPTSVIILEPEVLQALVRIAKNWGFKV